MEFSPDDSILAVGCNDGKVKLWDPRTGKLERTLFAADFITYLGFSGNGKTLLTYNTTVDFAKFWDTSTWEIRSIIDLRGMHEGILPPYSDYVAGVFRGGTTKLWELSTGTERRISGTDSLSAVALSADDMNLATGSEDGTVRIWDVSTLEERLSIQSRKEVVEELLFSPDSKRLGVSYADSIFELWDVSSANQPNKIIQSTAVDWVGFSRDGRMFITSDGDDLQLRDSSTRKVCRTLENAGWCYPASMSSSNGRLLVSARPHDLWWEQRASWLPDVPLIGSWFARDSRQEILVWDVATGQLEVQFLGSGVLSFSRDGKTLALADEDERVLLFQVPDPE